MRSRGSSKMAPIRFADAPPFEKLTKIRLTEMTAFKIMVKYDVKAMMSPTFTRPADTRYAPTKITAAIPRLSTAFISGFVTPIVTPALVSFATTSSLILRNVSLSYSVLESALMTRMPV